MTNKPKGLTKIVNVCNKLGVNYEISHTEYVFGEEYFQNYAIKINNHYFIAHKGGIVVDKVNRAYGEGQFFCKNQTLALCYIFGYNNVLPNNYIIVDLDDSTGEILGYTVEETQAPQEETQEETQAPTVTLSSDDIKQIKELMHDLGTDLDGICELSNNVSISSNCLDESHYTSTLTLSNEDYAFTFNVHTGVLESVTNCDTMEYETLDNYLIESFEDIIKAIRRAHKAHEEEKARKYYIKACHPYIKAFEEYTIFNKKELQKEIINWACVYQKALLCAEHSGLVNKNYSKDMFIKSLKEATQKISHDIVRNNKPKEDFIKNQTQSLALQTLECYYSDMCFGFGLVENDVKNAIKKVKLESVAI